MKKIWTAIEILLTVILYIAFTLGSIFVMLGTPVVAMLDLFDNIEYIAWIGVGICYIGVVAGIVVAIKKDKSRFLCKKPLLLLTILFMSVLIFAGIYVGTRHYFSVYTNEKWKTYTMQRQYMIEDLKSKYEFEGMTAAEVVDILGEPEWQIGDEDDGEIGYSVGMSMIDPYVFFLETENGVVTQTRMAAYG